MSSLQSVEIRDVKTSELINLRFPNVLSMTSLKIERYNFTLFPNKPFQELINPSELYIRHGKLRVLPEDLFYNLHNLTKLDLSDNDIESIHPLVFRNLIRLEYLNLKGNRIKDLPSDMLKGLLNLRKFYIFEIITYHKFRPDSLKTAQLDCIFRMGCSFSSLEDDVFSDLINLKSVDLDFNQIEHLPPNLLRNNKLLTSFSCSYNKISNLPTRVFPWTF
ncbi:leucine-rich repeat-containing protein 15-like [Centruroides vittatus]|uniref:leucine-rich repeat-containing protein 15-like n=1 Tax=Centruroides vittatus TaxID=120091 RepID=UPI00350FB6DF